MENEQKFIVYKHTSPDGKIYIGITAKSLEERSRNGNGYYQNKEFYASIQKYGWENFRHEVLYENLEELQARLMERSLIRFYKSNEPEFGYNDSIGGEKPNMLGKQHKEEAKNKISEGHKGKQLSEEHKHKISEGNKGKQLSEEAKNKISESKLGENNPMFGRCGENNPTYGKKWYNNGEINVRREQCPEGFVPGQLKRA